MVGGDPAWRDLLGGPRWASRKHAGEATPSPRRPGGRLQRQRPEDGSCGRHYVEHVERNHARKRLCASERLRSTQGLVNQRHSARHARQVRPRGHRSCRGVARLLDGRRRPRPPPRSEPLTTSFWDRRRLAARVPANAPESGSTIAGPYWSPVDVPLRIIMRPRTRHRATVGVHRDHPTRAPRTPRNIVGGLRGVNRRTATSSIRASGDSVLGIRSST